MIKKKKQERTKERIPLHIQRIGALIEVQSSSTGAPSTAATEKMEVRVLVSDLSTKGVGIFLPKPLKKGQEIVVTFKDPIELVLRGRIVWTQEFNVGSHILSSQTFPFRAGIEFNISTEEEKKGIQELCDHFK